MKPNRTDTGSARARRSHYEGRALPRPAQDIDEQGLAFDVTTLIGRRSVLRLLGLGVAGVGLAACSNNAGNGSASTPASSSAPSSSSGSGASTGSSEIPEETAGPYPGDGSNGPDVLEQSGIVRTDIRSSFGSGSATAEGVPITLELTITDLVKDAAFAGVAVYVWHCDRDGNYSLYSDGVTDENYLRGVQIADSDGKVTFTSVFPACYSGRWPHIHFEVYPNRKSITGTSNAIATSQVALPKTVCDTVYATDGYSASVQNLSGVSLATDNVFGDDSGVTQLATVTGSVRAGYTVALVVGVDTRTDAGGGGTAPGSDGRPAGGNPGGGGRLSGAPPGGGRPSGAPPGAGGPGGNPPGGNT